MEKRLDATTDKATKADPELNQFDHEDDASGIVSAPPRDEATSDSESTNCATRRHRLQLRQARSLVTNAELAAAKSGRARARSTRSAPSVTPDAGDADLVERYLAVIQQTTAANRVIGRLNFERDALSRQVEALRLQRGQAAPPSPARPGFAASPVQPVTAPGRVSLFAALQRFLNDGDIGHVRMRRMGLVFGLLAVVALAWAISRTGMVVFPAKISRDSLGDLPFVGTTLRFVMGVWSMFRVVRIGARGVRWAFPEERSRRRRR